jgi:hypothetical protein
MEQSTLGEYAARLNILFTFHCHVVHMQQSACRGERGCGAQNGAPQGGSLVFCLLPVKHTLGFPPLLIMGTPIPRDRDRGWEGS